MPFRTFVVEEDLGRAFVIGTFAAGLIASARPHAAMSLAMGLAWFEIGACDPPPLKWSALWYGF